MLEYIQQAIIEVLIGIGILVIGAAIMWIGHVLTDKDIYKR